MREDYILIEELKGNEDLHKIAKEILFEDKSCCMQKNTTKNNF